MAVTYKDIDSLSQKSIPEGTEKLPVSDTEYITVEQIVMPVEEAIAVMLTKQSLDGLTRYKNQINSSGQWTGYSESDPDTCVLLPITPGKKYAITGSGQSAGYFAVIKQSSPGSGNVQFATGYSSRLSLYGLGSPYIFVAPSDAVSLYLLLVNHSSLEWHFVVYEVNFVAEETDPVFVASAAHGISSSDISTWNAKQKAITVSSSEPTSSDGSNGDIWIVI